MSTQDAPSPAGRRTRIHLRRGRVLLTDLTPDDADQLGDALKQAAQRAREVTEALQARWGL